MTGISIFSENFTNRKKTTAHLKYHMSIMKSQAILKRFIDLKFRVGFTGLRKPNHVLWHFELFSGRLPVKVFKTLNDRQSYIFSKFHKLKKPAKPNYHTLIKKSQAILKCFIDLKFSIWFMLGSENKSMFCS